MFLVVKNRLLMYLSGYPFINSPETTCSGFLNTITELIYELKFNFS